LVAPIPSTLASGLRDGNTANLFQKDASPVQATALYSPTLTTPSKPGRAVTLEKVVTVF